MGHIEKNMIQGIEFSETSRHHKKRGRDFHSIFERGKKTELFFFLVFSFVLTMQSTEKCSKITHYILCLSLVSISGVHVMFG